MALNFEDLIGAMQHGFHAGDRGADLDEIRESLKHSLGQQALGGSQTNQRPRQQPQQHSFPRQWDPRQPPSSLDGEVAMISGSLEVRNQTLRWPMNQQAQQQLSPSQPRGATTLLIREGFSGQSPSQNMSFGGPGSFGSQGSSVSSLGLGFAPAPANTPQQTPVETSALARQLQAELERTRASQGYDSISEVDEQFDSNYQPVWHQQSLSPPTNGLSEPLYEHQHQDQIHHLPNPSPKYYVNGFFPSQISDSLSASSPQEALRL